ncbi:hypothetical protein [Paenibacillus soyae]|uniref:Uncharacterized protein n=1 Tax=Paenibacillus soyae TaxID=2969249 RepID=A0A9X2MK74_9BACL|nr:hypothetical protein [Paenibacillus soyae]MCR2803413.1 hypothetical protein [Paenibacillus soyae]
MRRWFGVLSDRSRKILRVLWNLYRHEAVRLNYGRLGRMIGLNEKQINAALSELEEKRCIARKEGHLQVLRPWDERESRRPAVSSASWSKAL